ncbi:MAG: DUF1018 domain-containing protein [Candidatus Kapabacteria bacterium]|nr:DUF1018 domain-containing protein [Candidatus Kapabacteria bacterium]
MKKRAMITGTQVALMHTLKQRLGMNDDEYRDALNESAGVESSRDLTFTQAHDIINGWVNIAIERGVWHKPEQQRISRHSALANRTGAFPTVQQLDMIDREWAKVSRIEAGDDRNKALDKMCQRILKKPSVANILRRDVQKLVRTIRAMKSPTKPEGEHV